MNAQKEYFIYLLSCFLSGETPQGREVDFEDLFRLAEIHNVGAIIANELQQVEKAFQPTGKLASEFTQTIGLTLREYTHRESGYRFIKRILDDALIPHLFVKGIVLQHRYPIPEMRTSGDIDIIICREDFDKAAALMEQNAAFTVVEKNSEVIAVRAFGVELEVHNDADVGGRYFDDIFAIAEKSNGYTYRLNDYDHLLYIICHLAKHLSYRGAGIRMLMDIDVMVRSIPEFDLTHLLTLCDTAHIRKTAEALLSLSAFWLHTPIEMLVDFRDETHLLDNFERVMLDGGSFGYEQNAIPVVYLEGATGSVLSRIRVLLKMAFPSRDYLKICYPYYKKYAWLYPVARIHRLWDGLFRKRKAAAGAIQQVTSQSGTESAQLALMKELEIQYKRSNN